MTQYSTTPAPAPEILAGEHRFPSLLGRKFVRVADFGLGIDKVACKSCALVGDTWQQRAACLLDGTNGPQRYDTAGQKCNTTNGCFHGYHYKEVK